MTYPPRKSTLTQRPRVHLEVVDVRSGTPRITGLGGIFKTDELTREEFEHARKELAVPMEQAEFLIDYYDPSATLVDTIAITSEGFKRIFKEGPPPPEYFEIHDEVFRASKSPNVVEAHEEARTAANAAFTTAAKA